MPTKVEGRVVKLRKGDLLPNMPTKEEGKVVKLRKGNLPPNMPTKEEGRVQSSEAKKRRLTTQHAHLSKGERSEAKKRLTTQHAH